MAKKALKMFLDCGAPSLYNQYMRADKTKGVHTGAHMGDRRHDDYSFLESADYRKYLEKYVDFLKREEKRFEVYANFDVINNPEKTWENQQYLEKEGLKPIPVFHLGSDTKWLKMYLDKGHKYIALGGIVPNPVPVVVPMLDNIWFNHLVDKDGMPKVKVHGFAVTSTDLMRRYPWYSVDSTSWVLYGRFGIVLVPRFRNGQWCYYEEDPLRVAFSTRQPCQKQDGKHYNSFSDMERKQILKYLDEEDRKIGVSEFIEVYEGYELDKSKNEKWLNDDQLKLHDYEIERVIEWGVINDYPLRDEMNFLYFIRFEQESPEWPWPFQLKKKRFGRG